MLQPGTVLTFRLENGLYGACRVLRGPVEAEQQKYQGHVLIHATKWVGELPLDLKHADLRKVLRGPRGPSLHWMKGTPSGKFKAEGIVPVRQAEQTKKSNSTAPWGIFPNAVFTQWEKENDPARLAKKQETAKQESKKKQRDLLADLTAKEQIDLTGFVPLAKPKAEREPVEVLRGFIAAMHQWEKECGRISKKSKINAPVPQFSQDAMQQIFDEFCTPKDRKYGRLGSFGMPPEYNPRHEKILAVRECTPSRVEIDTHESSGFKRNLTYVLIRKKQTWLIDSKKSNGRNTIL